MEVEFEAMREAMDVLQKGTVTVEDFSSVGDVLKKAQMSVNEFPSLKEAQTQTLDELKQVKNQIAQHEEKLRNQDVSDEFRIFKQQQEKINAEVQAQIASGSPQKGGSPASVPNSLDSGDLAGQFAHLNQRIDEISSSQNVVITNINKQTAGLRSLSQRMDDKITRTHSDLQSRLSDSESDLEDVKKQLKSLLGQTPNSSSTSNHQINAPHITESANNLASSIRCIKHELRKVRNSNETDEEMNTESIIDSINILKNSMQTIKDEMKNMKILHQPEFPQNLKELVDSLEQSIDGLQDSMKEMRSDVNNMKDDVSNTSSICFKAQRDLECLKYEVEKWKNQSPTEDTTSLPVFDRLKLLEERIEALSGSQINTIRTVNAQKSALQAMKNDYYSNVTDKIVLMEKQIQDLSNGNFVPGKPVPQPKEQDPALQNFANKVDQMINELTDPSIQERSVNLDAFQPSLDKALEDLTMLKKDITTSNASDEDDDDLDIDESKIPFVIQSIDQIVGEIYTEMYQIRDNLTDEILNLRAVSMPLKVEDFDSFPETIKSLKHELMLMKKQQNNNTLDQDTSERLNDISDRVETIAGSQAKTIKSVNIQRAFLSRLQESVGKDLDDRMETVEKEIETLRDQLNTIKVTGVVADMGSARSRKENPMINELNEKIDELTNKLNDPTLDDNTSDQLSEQISKTRNDLQTLREAFSLIGEEEDIPDGAPVDNRLIRELQAKILILESTNKQQQESIDLLERASRSEQDTMKCLKHEVQKLKGSITETTDASNNERDDIKTSISNIENDAKNIRVLTERIEELYGNNLQVIKTVNAQKAYLAKLRETFGDDLNSRLTYVEDAIADLLSRKYSYDQKDDELSTTPVHNPLIETLKSKIDELSTVLRESEIEDTEKGAKVKPQVEQTQEQLETLKSALNSLLEQERNEPEVLTLESLHCMIQDLRGQMALQDINSKNQKSTLNEVVRSTVRCLKHEVRKLKSQQPAHQDSVPTVQERGGIVLDEGSDIEEEINNLKGLTERFNQFDDRLNEIAYSHNKAIQTINAQTKALKKVKEQIDNSSINNSLEQKVDILEDKVNSIYNQISSNAFGSFMPMDGRQGKIERHSNPIIDSIKANIDELVDKLNNPDLSNTDEGGKIKPQSEHTQRELQRFKDLLNTFNEQEEDEPEVITPQTLFDDIRELKARMTLVEKDCENNRNAAADITSSSIRRLKQELNNLKNENDQLPPIENRSIELAEDTPQGRRISTFNLDELEGEINQLQGIKARVEEIGAQSALLSKTLNAQRNLLGKVKDIINENDLRMNKVEERVEEIESRIEHGVVGGESWDVKQHIKHAREPKPQNPLVAQLNEKIDEVVDHLQNPMLTEDDETGKMKPQAIQAQQELQTLKDLMNSLQIQEESESDAVVVTPQQLFDIVLELQSRVSSLENSKGEFSGVQERGIELSVGDSSDLSPLFNRIEEITAATNLVIKQVSAQKAFLTKFKDVIGQSVDAKLDEFAQRLSYLPNGEYLQSNGSNEPVKNPYIETLKSKIDELSTVLRESEIEDTEKGAKVKPQVEQTQEQLETLKSALNSLLEQERNEPEVLTLESLHCMIQDLRGQMALQDINSKNQKSTLNEVVRSTVRCLKHEVRKLKSQQPLQERGGIILDEDRKDINELETDLSHLAEIKDRIDEITASQNKAIVAFNAQRSFLREVKRAIDVDIPSKFNEVHNDMNDLKDTLSNVPTSEPGQPSVHIQAPNDQPAVKWPVLKSPAKKKQPSPIVEALNMKIQDLVDEMTNASKQEDDDIDQIKPSMSQAQSDLNQMLSALRAILDHEEEDITEMVTPEMMWKHILEHQERLSNLEANALIRCTKDTEEADINIQTPKKATKKAKSNSTPENDESLDVQTRGIELDEDDNTDVNNNDADNKWRKIVNATLDKLTTSVHNLKKVVKTRVLDNPNLHKESIQSVDTQITAIEERINQLTGSQQKSIDTINAQTSKITLHSRLISEEFARIKELEDQLSLLPSGNASEEVQLELESIKKILSTLDEQEKDDVSGIKRQLDQILETIDDFRQVGLSPRKKSNPKIQKLQDQISSLLSSMNNPIIKKQETEKGELQPTLSQTEEDLQLVYNTLDGLSKAMEEEEDKDDEESEDIYASLEKFVRKLGQRYHSIEKILNQHHRILQALRGRNNELSPEVVQTRDIKLDLNDEGEENIGELRKQITSLATRVNELVSTQEIIINNVNNIKPYLAKMNGFDGEEINNRIEILENTLNDKLDDLFSRQPGATQPPSTSEAPDQLTKYQASQYVADLKAQVDGLLGKMNKPVYQSPSEDDELQPGVTKMNTDLAELQNTLSKILSNEVYVPVEEALAQLHERVQQQEDAIRALQQLNNKHISDKIHNVEDKVQDLKEQLSRVPQQDNETINSLTKRVEILEEELRKLKADVAKRQEPITPSRFDASSFLMSPGRSPRKKRPKNPAIEALKQQIDELVEKINSSEIEDEDDTTGELKPNLSKAHEDLRILQETLRRIIEYEDPEAVQEAMLDMLNELQYKVAQLEKGEQEIQSRDIKLEEDHEEWKQGMESRLEIQAKVLEESNEKLQQTVRCLKYEVKQLRKRESLSQVDNKLNDLSSRISELVGAQQDSAKAINNQEAQIQNELQRISELESQLEKVNSEEFTKEIKDELENLRNELNALNEQESIHEEQISAKSVDIDELKDKVEILQSQLNEFIKQGTQAFFSSPSKKRQPSPAVHFLKKQIDTLLEGMNDPDLNKEAETADTLSQPMSQAQSDLVVLQNTLNTLLQQPPVDPDYLTPEQIYDLLRELQTRIHLLELALKQQNTLMQTIAAEQQPKEEVRHRGVALTFESDESESSEHKPKKEESESNEKKPQSQVIHDVQIDSEEVQNLKAEIQNMKERIEEVCGSQNRVINNLNAQRSALRNMSDSLDNSINERVLSLENQLEDIANKVSQNGQPFTGWIVPSKNTKENDPAVIALKEQIAELVEEMEKSDLAKEDKSGQLHPHMTKAQNDLHKLQQALQNILEAPNTEVITPADLYQIVVEMQEKTSSLDDSKLLEVSNALRCVKHEIKLIKTNGPIQSRDIQLDPESDKVEDSEKIDILFSRIDELSAQQLKITDTLNAQRSYLGKVKELIYSLQDQPITQTINAPQDWPYTDARLKKQRQNPVVQALTEQINKLITELSNPEMRPETASNQDLNERMVQAKEQLKHLQDALSKILEAEDDVLEFTPENVIQAIRELQTKVSYLECHTAKDIPDNLTRTIALLREDVDDLKNIQSRAITLDSDASDNEDNDEQDIHQAKTPSGSFDNDIDRLKAHISSLDDRVSEIASNQEITVNNMNSQKSILNSVRNLANANIDQRLQEVEDKLYSHLDNHDVIGANEESSTKSARSVIPHNPAPIIAELNAQIKDILQELNEKEFQNIPENDEDGLQPGINKLGKDLLNLQETLVKMLGETIYVPSDSSLREIQRRLRELETRINSPTLDEDKLESLEQAINRLKSNMREHTTTEESQNQTLSSSGTSRRLKVAVHKIKKRLLVVEAKLNIQSEKSKKRRVVNPAIQALQQEIDKLVEQLSNSDLQDENDNSELKPRISEAETQLKLLREALKKMLEAQDQDEEVSLDLETMLKMITDLQSKVAILETLIQSGKLGRNARRLLQQKQQQRQQDGEISSDGIQTRDINLNLEEEEFGDDLTLIEKTIEHIRDRLNELVGSHYELINSVNVQRSTLGNLRRLNNDMNAKFENDINELNEKISSLPLEVPSQTIFAGWDGRKQRSPRKTNPAIELLKDQIDILVNQLNDPSLENEGNDSINLKPNISRAENELNRLKETLQKLLEQEEEEPDLITPESLLELLHNIEAKVAALEVMYEEVMAHEVQSRDIVLEEEENQFKQIEDRFESIHTRTEEIAGSQYQLVNGFNTMRKCIQSIPKLQNEVEELKNLINTINTEPIPVTSATFEWPSPTSNKRPRNPAIEALQQHIDKLIQQMNDPAIHEDDNNDTLNPRIESAQAELQQLQDTLAKLLAEEEENNKPLFMSPDELISTVIELRDKIVQLEAQQGEIQTREIDIENDIKAEKIDEIEEKVNHLNDRFEELCGSQNQAIKAFNALRSHVANMNTNELAERLAITENTLSEHIENHPQSEPSQSFNGWTVPEKRPTNPAIEALQQQIAVLIEQMDDPELHGDDNSQELDPKLQSAQAELLQLQDILRKLMEQEEPEIITPESLLDMIRALEAKVASLEVSNEHNKAATAEEIKKNIEELRHEVEHVKQQNEEGETLKSLKDKINGLAERTETLCGSQNNTIHAFNSLRTHLNKLDNNSELRDKLSNVEQSLADHVENHPSDISDEVKQSIENLNCEIQQIKEQCDHDSQYVKSQNETLQLLQASQERIINTFNSLRTHLFDIKTQIESMNDMVEPRLDSIEFRVDHIENHTDNVEWTIQPNYKPVNPEIEILKRQIEDVVDHLQNPSLDDVDDSEELKPNIMNAQAKLKNLQETLDILLKQENEPTVLSPLKLYCMICELQNSIGNLQSHSADQPVDEKNWKESILQKIVILQELVYSLQEQQQKEISQPLRTINEEVTNLKKSFNEMSAMKDELSASRQTPTQPSTPIMTTPKADGKPTTQEELVSYCDRLEKIAAGFDRHIIAAQGEIKKVGKIKNQLKDDSAFAKALQKSIKDVQAEMDKCNQNVAKFKEDLQGVKKSSISDDIESSLKCIKHEIRLLKQPIMSRSIKIQDSSDDDNKVDKLEIATLKDRIANIENEIQNHLENHAGFISSSSGILDDPDRKRKATAQAVSILSKRIDQLVEKLRQPNISQDDDSTGRLKPDIEKAENELLVLQTTLRNILNQQNDGQQENGLVPQAIQKLIQDIQDKVAEIENNVNKHDDVIEALEDKIPEETQQQINELIDTQNQASDQLEKHSDKLKKMKKQIQKLLPVPNTLETLAGSMQELDEELQKLKKQVEGSPKLTQDLLDKLKKLPAEVTRVNNELSQLQKYSLDLKNSLTESNENNEKTHKQLKKREDSMKQSIDNLIASVKSLEGSVGELQDKTQTQYQQINEELDQQKSKLVKFAEQLSGENKVFAKSLNDLKESLSNVKNESSESIKELLDSLKNVKQEINEHKEILTNLNPENVLSDLKQIKHELEKAKEALEENKISNNERDEHIQLVDQSIRDLQGEINSLNLNNFIEQVKDLVEENKEKGKTLEQLKEEIKELKSALDEIKEEYNSKSKKDMEDLKDTLESLKDGVDNNANEISTVQDTILSLTKEIESIKETAKAEIDDNADEISSLQDTILSLTKEIETVKETSKNDAAENADEISSLQDTILSLTKEIESVKETSKNDAAENADEISSLQDTILSLTKEIETVKETSKNDAAENAEEISSLQDTILSLTKEIETVKERVQKDMEENSDEISSLQDTILSLTAEIGAVKETTKAEINDNADEVSSLQDTVLSLTKEIESMKDHFKSEIEDNTDEISSLQDTILSITDKLNKFQQFTADQKNINAACEEEISKLVESLNQFAEAFQQVQVAQKNGEQNAETTEEEIMKLQTQVVTINQEIETLHHKQYILECLKSNVQILTDNVTDFGENMKNLLGRVSKAEENINSNEHKIIANNKISENTFAKAFNTIRCVKHELIASKRSHSKLADSFNGYIKEVNNEIENIKNQRTEDRSAVGKNTEKIESIEESMKSHIQSLEKVQEKSDDANKLISNLNENISQIEDKIATINEIQESQKDAILEHENQITQVIDSLHQFNNSLESLNSEILERTKNEEFFNLESQLNEVKGFVGEQDNHNSNFDKTLKAQKAQVDYVIENLTLMAENAKQITEKMSKIDDQQKENELHHNLHRKEIDNIRKELIELKSAPPVVEVEQPIAQMLDISESSAPQDDSSAPQRDDEESRKMSSEIRAVKSSVHEIMKTENVHTKIITKHENKIKILTETVESTHDALKALDCINKEDFEAFIKRHDSQIQQVMSSVQASNKSIEFQIETIVKKELENKPSQPGEVSLKDFEDVKKLTAKVAKAVKGHEESIKKINETLKIK
ncbi:hypothetical protein TRFO_37229 [Tritrichomonas foetus]|uniref:Uncharacterized protein n=1 Tax=Tritrichomonas foetus TaxID=1144522 RepID=A0A1J4JD66_9EUKA|nr:hypothetical protein TRFO_37229 [Tritrichomonas foetus]|eukprot:OHS96593.1 hypothetical protein TRFO_37229 [Tritrichomonas foetus]